VQNGCPWGCGRAAARPSGPYLNTWSDHTGPAHVPFIYYLCSVVGLDGFLVISDVALTCEGSAMQRYTTYRCILAKPWPRRRRSLDTAARQAERSYLVRAASQGDIPGPLAGDHPELGACCLFRVRVGAVERACCRLF
jgi:hypothetical protein